MTNNLFHSSNDIRHVQDDTINVNHDANNIVSDELSKETSDITYSIVILMFFTFKKIRQ